MSKELRSLRTSLESQGIDIVRLIFPDVLGITRSKDLLVSQIEHSAESGPAFCQGVWVTTTRGGVLDGYGSISAGLPDLVTKIDESTIRPMAWEPGVALAVADAFDPDGTDSPVSPRSVLRRVIARYHELGLDPIVGPELEFYIAEETPDGWRRALNKVGRVYTTGAVVDPRGVLLHTMRMLDKLNIRVFAGNHEFSPSQYEINILHGAALETADRTFLLKTAVKDISARFGLLATFMGKPWNDEGGSGFHLHFSVADLKSGNNAMHSGTDLSDVALHMTAGLIEHSAALSAFTNPTVNAFKRLGPDTLAPYRANWGYDNRSTMIRIPPERGSGTRLEVRIGDGAANPYLMIAAILAAALDGIERKLTPPAAVGGWTYEDESAPVLPTTLADALDALEKDEYLKQGIGQIAVETFMTLKRDEVDRYSQEVTDPSTREVTQWEIDEYLLDY